jgi:hypothetical protein
MQMIIRTIIPGILILFSLSCGRNGPHVAGTDLLPARTNPSPDYWCTWGAQNYASDTASLINSLSLGGPFNDEECPWDIPEYGSTGLYRNWGNGKVLEETVEIGRISHVLRTYDISQHLSIPTTLDRVSQLLARLSASGSDVVIDETGLSASTAGDRSLPGMVVRIIQKP